MVLHGQAKHRMHFELKKGTKKNTKKKIAGANAFALLATRQIEMAKVSITQIQRMN